jgi:hypothetical protein
MVRKGTLVSIINELTLPPQLFHMDFNEDGLVKEFGFYIVDRIQGNTGALGGAFGYFYGVGKPLPIRECQPFKPSFRFRMLDLIGKIAKNFRRMSDWACGNSTNCKVIDILLVTPCLCCLL